MEIAANNLDNVHNSKELISIVILKLNSIQ